MQKPPPYLDQKVSHVSFSPPRAPFPAPQDNLKSHLKIVKNESEHSQKVTPKKAQKVKKKQQNTKRMQQKKGPNSPKIRKISTKTPPEKKQKNDKKLTNFMTFVAICAIALTSWGVPAHLFALKT